MIAVVGKWTAEINLIFKEINTIIFLFCRRILLFFINWQTLAGNSIVFFFLKNKLQLVT